MAQLEQAVPAAAHIIDRGDPHGHRAQGGHPSHWDVDAPLARLEVDGLAHGVAPALDPYPVGNEKEAVHEDGGEGEVARDGVVKHRTLKGHPDGRPYLAVARDRNEDDCEVRGTHESHVDCDLPQPDRLTAPISKRHDHAGCVRPPPGGGKRAGG